MSNQPQTEPNPWVFVIGGIFLLALLANMFSGSSSSRTYSSASSGPDRSSREYRYVEERMKLEGMSGSYAKTAADAVMRFHEAQKARQR